MRAPQWNALVDAVAYGGFVLLSATGLVLEYQLPPGSGGLTGGRGGRGAGERQVDLLWGFTRHQWGDVHYWIALVLLAILAVHLALHWKWIVCMLQGKKSQASGLRFGLGVAGLVGVFALGALPLVAATKTTTRATLQQHAATASGGEPAVVPDEPIAAADLKTTAFADLRGRNTLADAADLAHVSVAAVRAAFQLPDETAETTRFSTFIHDRNLGMDDVRQMLAKLAASSASGNAGANSTPDPQESPAD